MSYADIRYVSRQMRRLPRNSTELKEFLVGDTNLAILVTFEVRSEDAGYWVVSRSAGFLVIENDEKNFARKRFQSRELLLHVVSSPQSARKVARLTSGCAVATGAMINSDMMVGD